MTTPAHSIAFRQFIRLPLLGAAWVERDDDRPECLPRFSADVDRAPSGLSNDGRGAVAGFTLRAGRWGVVVDRPTADRQGSASTGRSTGKQHQLARSLATVAWIALGAPLVTLAGISACLLAGPARHALASLQRHPARF